MSASVCWRTGTSEPDAGGEDSTHVVGVVSVANHGTDTRERGMLMEAFELTDESVTTPGGVVLHRIRAVRDLPQHGVRVGDLGGFVESSDNVSGEAWVSGKALVFGEALVCGEALVSDKAWVSGDAVVRG